MAKHQTTTDIRHPYYEMSDKLSVLQDATNSDPTLYKDDILQGILLGLRVDIDRLHRHLSDNYLWD